MPWKSIVGHDLVVEQFRTRLRQERLAHAYLFAGPEGIGKRRFAVTFAQGLLCERNPPPALDPCGQCAACKQVSAGTHPDYSFVAKPENRHEMPVELFIGSREQRGQEGLCYRLARKPARGLYKVAIIDDADTLNDESANCLLKTLEEPPPHSLLILIASNPELQLPTIRSRCALVRLAPLRAEEIRDLLLAQQAVSDPRHAELLAALSEGSVGRALALAEEDLWQFRTRLLEALPQITAAPRRAAPEASRTALSLAQEAQNFVESAGAESAPQRARARVLIGFCVELYRHALWKVCGTNVAHPLDEHHQQAVHALCRHLAPDGFTPAAFDHLTRLVQRCLEADEHIQRRVQLVLALEALFDDLAMSRH